MHRFWFIGLSLAAVGCARINPSFADGDDETEGAASGSGGAPSGTGSIDSDSATQGEGEDEGEGTALTTGVDPPAQWVFTDDEFDEFEAGVLEDLHWSEQDAVELVAGATVGTLRSRIFTTGGHLGHLTEIEWLPPAPYGVALFGPEVDEREGYDFGGADTTGLELLLHFDFPTDTLELGALVPDASAFAHHGTLGGAPLSVSRGVFARGVTNPGDGFIDHAQAQLAPGTTEFTWTAWYRSDDCSGAAIVSFDAPNGQAVETSSVWMLCNTNYACPSDAPPRHGTFSAVATAVAPDGSGTGPRACGLKPIDDNEWHHLAARMLHSGGGSTLELFVDGLPDEGVSPFFDSQHDYAQGALQAFTTIGNPAPEYGGAGSYDEITIWDRRLSDSEIRDLHTRGAGRVEFRVRACASEDCSDDPPFIGPMGAAGIGFVDSGPEDGHAHDVWEFDQVGVAFQYELRMTLDSAAVPSPRIPLVSLVAEPAEND